MLAPNLQREVVKRYNWLRSARHQDKNAVRIVAREYGIGVRSVYRFRSENGKKKNRAR